MKIALIAGPYVPVPPLKYGGTERVIYYLIKGLKELGHEPVLIGPGDSEVDCQIIPSVEKAIQFPRHKKDVKTFRQQERNALADTRKLVGEVIPSVDVIHSHGVDLINFSHVPNLTTLHGMVIFEQIPYYLRRRKLNYACISRNQHLALRRLNCIGVAYNGLDPEEFPVVTEPEDYVCFLGRFDREKNPHLALQLAISLGIKIKIAGKIDFEGDGYFEEEVEKYFDHELVEYLGELGLKEKTDLLSKARCNLHPTGFREPFGLTVLEAAYCGTPTLAISRGSMPELIEDRRTGLLVEDFVEGYDSLKDCFEMDREYIANRARLLFNYKKMAQDYVSLYKLAINRTESSKRFPKIKI